MLHCEGADVLKAAQQKTPGGFCNSKGGVSAQGLGCATGCCGVVVSVQKVWHVRFAGGFVCDGALVHCVATCVAAAAARGFSVAGRQCWQRRVRLLCCIACSSRFVAGGQPFQ